MRKLLVFLSVILWGTMVWAQETDTVGNGFVPPDYKFIYSACSDPSSNFYYPTLAARFAQADTSLSLAELRAFYYGQVYQPNYTPYGPARKQFEAIQSIMLKEEEPTHADFDSIVFYADQAIAEHPAEPMAYYYKFIGLNAIYQSFGGDTVERTRAQMQFQMLFYAIESTGNGLNTSQPFYVACTSHEYMMLNIYGFEPRGQALTSEGSHTYDLHYLQENDYGVDSLYFNIDPMFELLTRMFDSSLDFDPDEKVTSLELPVGTKFVLEMVKTKRKESTFRVLSLETVEDTLYSHDLKLFPESIPENQIVGYFAPTRLLEDSDVVSNCLLFKSNSKKDMLFMDTHIRYGGSMEYESTSNSGLLRNCLMNEMWPTSVTNLRISNLRTKE